MDHWQALDRYLEPIMELGRSPDMACLCGVLGGEFLSLPEQMKPSVADFFAEHQAFMAKLLTAGRDAGAFSFSGSPEALARLMFSAIEGAMIIKRANRDTGYLDDIVSIASDLLGGRPG